MGLGESDARIRLGIVSCDARAPAWQLAVLRHLLAVEGVELALVIDAAPAPRRLEMTTEEAPQLPSSPLERVSIDADFRDAERVSAEECSAQRLADVAVDLLWTPEPVAARREWFSAVRGGVWTLDIDGGDTSCDRALLRGQPQIGVRLLALAEPVGTARQLADAYYRNEPFAPALTRARVLYQAATLPARQVRAWRLQGNAALEGKEVSWSAPRRPYAPMRALLPLRQLASFVHRAWVCCHRDQWAVGLSRAPIGAFLHPRHSAQITWLEEAPEGDYHADPFGVNTATGPVLLAERFDAARGLGRIDVLQPQAGTGIEVVRDVLGPDCHLSYPYVIEHEGEVYCVPETHQQRCISLYRGDPFPTRWTRVATLVEGFAGVDATLFMHGGLWWMLCCTQDDEPYANLYGFYAESLTGPWRAHPLNPLKCDPRSSRPGGTPFRHGDALYRPSQDCSSGYGGAIWINRVDVLTPTAFAETPVVRVAPDKAGRYPHGLHTLSAVGEHTVIDGMRRVFAPAAALRAAAHFLSRIRGYRRGQSGALAAGSVRGGE